MRKIIFLAGGCFWGVEAYFQKLKGVTNTEVGYCNGNVAFPKYEDLKTGKATHAETVKIEYEDSVISLSGLLEHYLRFVDPYSVDRQGEDEGRQYRSGIYYNDVLDGVEAVSYLSSHLKPGWKIEVQMMRNFYPAEERHQHYLSKNPGGYCHVNLDLIKPSEKK
ncbi:MAG: peptide-methionine (S)-S-oxide reductase MsrA [Bacilli bacterium]|jgi:methionine-S-sulfoxide reductase|nr:peptide-methionine (S)-S-oxide reductase MsrA [Bacilli bacterium]